MVNGSVSPRPWKTIVKDLPSAAPKRGKPPSSYGETSLIINKKKHCNAVEFSLKDAPKRKRCVIIRKCLSQLPSILINAVKMIHIADGVLQRILGVLKI